MMLIKSPFSSWWHLIIVSCNVLFGMEVEYLLKRINHVVGTLGSFAGSLTLPLFCISYPDWSTCLVMVLHYFLFMLESLFLFMKLTLLRFTILSLFSILVFGLFGFYKYYVWLNTFYFIHLMLLYLYHKINFDSLVIYFLKMFVITSFLYTLLR